MSDDVVRLSVIGRIVRWRWRLLVALAIVGALVGAGASLLFSPGYESTSGVLLQGPREEDEVLTEAELATSPVVLNRTATALGGQATGADLRDSVHAEVINGNVIEVSATSDSPEAAQRLADQVATEYVTFSAQLVNSPTDASAQIEREQIEALRLQVEDSNRRIDQLHGEVTQGDLSVEDVQTRTALEALRTALGSAITDLEEVEAATGRANIVVIGPASLPSGPSAPTPLHFVAGGAVLFFLIGLFANLAAARADHRLRGDSEIAAALGAPMIGAIDVPQASPAGDPPPGPGRWRARLRQLLGSDRPWDTPQLPISGNSLSRSIRYRRALARLRGGPDTVLRMLVLVPDDDATAHQAVGHLAVAAGIDGGPASVVTDSPDLSRLVQSATRDAAPSDVRLTVRPSSDPAPGSHRTVLHVVDLCAARPEVPDHRGVSEALVVVTAGTRTAWELAGIAAACEDAGYQVAGAVVTFPAGQVNNPAAVAQPRSPQISVNGNAMAGSA